MQYSFLTTWLLAAERPAVWNVLQDPLAWPEWWSGLESAVQLDAGDVRRVGSVYRVRWRAPLGYRVQFDFHVDEVDEPRLMRGRASGDLEGRGTWRLFEDGGVTAVTYAWQVRVARPALRALGPAARPLLAWSHHRVMARGGEGLARRLGCRLPAGS